MIHPIPESLIGEIIQFEINYPKKIPHPVTTVIVLEDIKPDYYYGSLIASTDYFYLPRDLHQIVIDKFKYITRYLLLKTFRY